MAAANMAQYLAAISGECEMLWHGHVSNSLLWPGWWARTLPQVDLGGQPHLTHLTHPTRLDASPPLSLP